MLEARRGNYFNAKLKLIPWPEVGFNVSCNDALLKDSDANLSKWSGVWVDLDKQF